MSNKSIIGVGAVILVAGGAYYFLQDSQTGEMSNKAFADAYIAYTQEEMEKIGFTGLDITIEDLHYNRTTDFVSIGKMTYGFDNVQMPAELAEFAAGLKGVSVVIKDMEMRGGHTYDILTGALTAAEAYEKTSTNSLSIEDIHFDFSDASPFKAQLPIYTSLLGLQELPAIQNVTASIERENGIDSIKSSLTLEHFFTIDMDIGMATIPAKYLFSEDPAKLEEELEAYIENDFRLSNFNIAIKDHGLVERSLNVASAVQGGVPVASLKETYTSIAAAQLSSALNIPEDLRVQMVQYFETLLMGGKTVTFGFNAGEPILFKDIGTLATINPDVLNFSVE